MGAIFTEQFIIIFVTLTTAFTYLLKELGKEITEYLKVKLELKQKIAEATVNIEIEKLKKNAERENLKEDKLLQLQLNRSVLIDGIKISHILKELRETLDAQSVSIAIYHNGVAKGFKNFSFRFQECVSMKYSTIYNYQAMPLSSHYSEIGKYEEVEYLHYNNKSKNLPFLIGGIMEQYKLKTLTSYPILFEHIDNDNLPNNVINIEKDNKQFALLGSIIVAIDDNCSKITDESVAVNHIKKKLFEIMLIYKENNNIFS